MADTLSELLSNVNSYKSGSEKATEQILGILGSQQELNQSISTAYSLQAEDESTIAAAKIAAENNRQLMRVKAANAAGANLQDTSEQITALSKVSADAYNKKTEALKAIEQKQSINFLDNPLGYLSAQFTVNDDIARHNIANAQLHQAQDRIKEINTEAQASMQTQNMIGEPITAAAAQAATRNAATVANINSFKSQIEGLNYGAKGIETALNAKKEVIALDFQANAAKNAASSLDLQRQGFALQQKEFEFRQAEYQDRRTDRKDKLDIEQNMIKTINLGRAALLGDKATPLDEMSGKTAIQVLRGTGKLSGELQKYYDAGEQVKLTGGVVVGNTPAAAMETMRTVPVALNPTQGAVKNILGQAAADTSNAIKMVDSPLAQGKNGNPVFVGLDKKDKNSIEAAYNGRAQQILNGYSAEIKPGDTDNPNQIASINTLAANSPTIQALPLYQKVFAPLVKSGVQLTDPKQIFSLVGDAAAKGIISHDEALELTTIYHVGVKANMAMRNFEGFGLKPNYSYNARVETNPNGFTTSEVVDLTKPDLLSRALLKARAAILSEQYSSGARNIFTGKQSNTGTLFDYRGTAPDSMFQPQPQQADAVSKAADKISNSVDTFFNTPPHSSDSKKTR